MTEPNKGGNPLSVVMLITLLVGGVVLESQLNLQSSRPVLDSKIHHHHHGEEDVDARLWEDPFEAVDQSQKSHQNDHNKKLSQIRWLIFQKSLNKKLESGPITVLGVMVSSRPYFVDAENRIRTRYAVVSGLASSGYQPKNSEYIGYLEGNLHHVHGKLPKHIKHHHLPEKLPYEWFVKENKIDEGKKDHVLVLWLGDRHFFHEDNEVWEKRPLHKIQVLFQHLVAPKKNIRRYNKNAVFKLDKIESGKFRFVVIGPPHSGQLGEMVKEVSKPAFRELEQDLPGIEIFSTRATKDEQQILQRVSQDSPIFLIWKYLKIWKIFNGNNIFSLRTKLIDLEFSYALIKAIENPGQTFQRVYEESSNLSILDYFNENNINLLHIRTKELEFFHALVEAIKNHGQIYQEFPSNLSISDHFNNKGIIHFLRTTPTDLELAQALVKELKLRGVRKNSPIALVSEWDTHYGRAFKDTICKAWRNEFDLKENNTNSKSVSKSDKDDPCAEYKKSIHYFSYLSGLDGQLPESADNEKDRDNKKSSSKELDLRPENATNLRAEREKQYDYLLRLAENIEETEKNFESEKGFLGTFDDLRFKAFGILGSDYYDKLVVLEALRKKFSHAHFFTTDLDARYFHAEDFKHVRNLIVASGFGLSLRKEFQGTIPPFRDTYQTSAYLATMLALEPEKCKKSLSQEDLNQWLKARVYEIGRNKAFDISIIKKDTKVKRLPALTGCSASNLYIDTGKIEHPSQANLGGWKKYVISLVIFLLMILPLVLLILKPIENWKWRTLYFLIAIIYIDLPVFLMGLVDTTHQPYLHLKQFHHLIPEQKYIAFGIFIIVLLFWVVCKFNKFWKEIIAVAWFFAGYMVLVVYLDFLGDEELLFIFEGVSIWPTDFLRLAGVMLALFFIPFYHKKLKSNWDRMQDNFMLSDTNIEKKWSPYKKRELIIKVAKNTVVFLVISGLLLLTFGLPFIPVRGNLSSFVDIVFLFFYVVSFSVSLFYSGVYLEESYNLIKAFKDTQLEWSDRVKRKIFDPLKISGKGRLLVQRISSSNSALLDGPVSLRFIAERTNAVDGLIFFPFWLLAIGILSRNRVFDNWDFPITLLSIFGFGAIYIFIKAFQVRRKANRYKDDILDLLHIQQIQIKAIGRRNEEKMTQFLISNTENYKKGAFLPWQEHPFFIAILLPFSGFGAVALLEYIFLAL